jgi:hypothetical protein
VASWTSYDLSVLEKAIATGAKKVKYSNDKEIEYRDLGEMLKLRDFMIASLDSSGTNTRVIETGYSR